MLPSCNGVMTVSRDYMGETPSGMKFTTLAGVMGGGASSPLEIWNVALIDHVVGDFLIAQELA